MRTIDLQSWPRRQHFEFFSAFDHPHFGMTANVDLSRFYPVIKQRGYSISVAIVYLISRVANAIPEFRYRIRGGQVVEHEVVHPSTTILVSDDLFSFCTFDYVENFAEFSVRAEKKITQVRAHLELENDVVQDQLLFMTAIPWVSFTSFVHPMHLKAGDSIPRFAWGKFFQDGDRLKMPLGVQAHHALMDGFHVGKFYSAVQEYLDSPDSLLGVDHKKP